jgi:phage gp36-like protein
MPSYANLQDLIERAGETEILEIADRDGDQVADPDVVSAALAEADRKINGYLAVRYLVPLSTIPDTVVGWAVVIARYVLHRDGAPDHVVRDYRDALAELKDAAAGRLALPDVAGIEPDQSSDGATVAEGSEAQFTRDKLEGWV